nr:hypothetical transcript [Hymenolepis microstoma]
MFVLGKMAHLITAPKMQSTEGASTTKEFEADSCGEKFRKALRDNLFTVLTLIGVVVGFGVGFGIGTLHPSQVTITWIKMPGTIFIRLLQLTVLPVIAANIIVVMAKMDLRENGKIGLATIGFVLAFDLLSGVVGVTTAALIKPGLSTSLTVNESDETLGKNDAPVTTSDVFADLLLNIFADNVVGLAIFQTKTIRVWTYFPVKNVTEPVQIRLESTNMIGLIFTSIVFGIAARTAKENGKAFIDLFDSLGNVVLILMRWFLLATPVGVCFMVAGAVVGLNDIAGTFQGLGLFMGSVLVALAIHMLLQMAIYTLASFRNPFRLMVMGFKAFFLSFITTAPIVAIPEMLETCDRYGIDNKVSRFAIPFSAALKGDGSGVFQAVACIFIAQQTGYNITIGTYVIIALLVGFASLAIPSVPSAAIIIIITILSSVGVSTAEVSLLFAVEWIMDRCRSGSMGLGYLFTAAFAQAIAEGKTKKGQIPNDEEIFVDDLESYTHSK